MKTLYFSECKNLDEVKQLYKSLAKIHHPDKGGDLETMKLINVEYDFVSERLLKGMGLNEEDRKNQSAFSKEYREKVNGIIHLEGIVVELSGTWIWVTGNTQPVKEILKLTGFFWAKNKGAWFWRPEAEKCKNTKPISLDQIRAKYGSERIDSKRVKELIS
jgi:curved DNA-binding protein CbpA